MAVILIVGFAMALLSVWFWYLELRRFLDAVEGRPWWLLPFHAIFNIGKLLPFIIDVAITLFCVANLGFGGGVLGGISGLFLSNIISCFILYQHSKAERGRKERRDWRLANTEA